MTAKLGVVNLASYATTTETLDLTSIVLSNISANLNVALNVTPGFVEFSASAVGSYTFDATIADTAARVSNVATFNVEAIADGTYIFTLAVADAPEGPALVRVLPGGAAPFAVRDDIITGVG